MFVLTRKDKIIACHDKKQTIIKYKNSILDSNENEEEKFYKMYKIKRSKFSNYVDIDDVYLVRYGDTYIPYKYLESMEVVSSQFIYDNEFCIDILYKFLEDPSLSEKELNHIEKTIKIIERFNEKDREYTPNIDILDGYFNMVENNKLYKNIIEEDS